MISAHTVPPLIFPAPVLLIEEKIKALGKFILHSFYSVSGKI